MASSVKLREILQTIAPSALAAVTQDHTLAAVGLIAILTNGQAKTTWVGRPALPAESTAEVVAAYNAVRDRAVLDMALHLAAKAAEARDQALDLMKKKTTP